MTFEEYVQGGRELYADLADAVAAIIEAAIKAHPSIRRLQVQRRAKAPESLAAKIGSGEHGKIEEKAKDLAGVRVVLYSNSDVDRLTHSRTLFDNFEVVWERTKLHYPRGSEGSSQFIGDNYVVRLKESRTVLPEYSRFAGLLCEVQVQTILNHAWSETAHDTIYKSPKLKGVGAAQLRKIEERMKRIQETYLLPAGYEFQQALNDFERIASGQRLVDSDILAAIRDAPDNNLRVERLEEYESLVLPIVDDLPSVASNIRSTMVDAVKRSLIAPTTPIETPIGTLPGRGIGDVVDGALSILKTLSYVEPAESYQTLSEIFVSADEGARTKVVQAVRELAQHSLPVWQEYGPAVQEILLDAIATTPPDRLASTRPLMIEVAGRCLAPEVTGTSNTSSTFTWQTDAVAVSDRLNQVRDRAFSLLTELMNSSQSDLERRQIFSALENSTHLPHQGQYADDLMCRAFADTVALIRFLSTTFEEFGDPLKETIEQSVFFLFRRCRDMPAELLKSPSLEAARDEVMVAAREFRDRVNALGDYVAFKTLVGFETVFPYEWEESERASTDFEAKAAHRQERIDELLTTVTTTTADEWFGRLNKYAAIESEDLATFPHLGAFIASVAKAHPKIGNAWLDRSQDQPIAQFIPGLLHGLYNSDPAAATHWVDEATNQNGNLSSIAVFLRHADPALPERLAEIARRAVVAENDSAALTVLEAVAARPEDFGLPLARRLCVEMIAYLDSRRRYRWTHPIWLWGKRQGLLMQLDDRERNNLFVALRNLPTIDYHAEEILAAFANSNTAAVIDLFGERLEWQRQYARTSIDDRFEAVPFDFKRLQEAMTGASALALPRAFEWYVQDPVMAEFKSARFISNLFPEPSFELIQLLTEYAKSKEVQRQEFVIAIMTNYHGSPAVHAVLRELVAVLDIDDPLLRDVRIALGATGVMRGEFGHRDALISQQSGLDSWLADPREPVRRFAEDLRKSLDNALAAAQRSAEADIAMRRLAYGEPLSDPGPREDGANQ